MTKTRNHGITLYNVLFPIWFLLAFPVTWLIVIPVNFAVDSAVMIAGLSYLRVVGRREVYRRAIIKVVAFGFISDIIGSLLLFATVISSSFLPSSELLNDVQAAVAMNPWSHPLALLIVTAAVGVAGALIYALNFRFAFAGAKLDVRQRRWLCAALAVVTAPWVFYFPSGLLYR